MLWGPTKGDIMLHTSTAAFDLAHPFAFEDAQEAPTEQEAIEWEDFDAREDGPSDEDMAFYVEEIMSGNYDEREEAEGEWAEERYDPDYFFHGDERSALDMYERQFYGD